MRPNVFKNGGNGTQDDKNSNSLSCQLEEKFKLWLLFHLCIADQCCVNVGLPALGSYRNGQTQHLQTDVGGEVVSEIYSTSETNKHF